MDSGAWRATACGLVENRHGGGLSTHAPLLSLAPAPPHPWAVTEHGPSAAGSAAAHWLSVLHVGLFICQLYSPISSHLKFFFLRDSWDKAEPLIGLLGWRWAGQSRRASPESRPLWIVGTSLSWEP